MGRVSPIKVLVIRIQQLFALRWDALDLVEGVVHVRASVFRGRRGPPKTGLARTVPMTEELRDKLR